MKTIIVEVSTGYVGSKNTMEFQIEDDANEDTINEVALECMWEMIDFNWLEKETK